MLPFKITPLGEKILFKYCERNPLLEVYLIKEGDKGFQVRMKDKHWFNKLIHGSVLFWLERRLSECYLSDKEQKEKFYLHLDTNMIWELEIDELDKLTDIMNLCRDKNEDDE